MPDISKINAVAVADIEKLDSILAANIEKVNGLVFSTAPAFTGLLDTYTGADAAFSVRRLASATTVLLRVRRDTGGGTGDDDEADVAYDSNNELSLDSAISNPSGGVTATTLGQFINVGTVGGTTYTNPDSLSGTAEARLTTWYDQASTNDATTRTLSIQAQIHAGTVDTDINKENGKPIVVNTGNTNIDYGLGNDPQQIYGVIKATTAVTNQSVLGSSNDAFLLLMTSQGSSSELKFSRVTTRDNGAAYTGTTRNDARLAFADQTLLYCDYTTTATNADLHFGFDVSFPMANMQEMTIYPDTATHTVADVEANINGFFGIY